MAPGTQAKVLPARLAIPGADLLSALDKAVLPANVRGGQGLTLRPLVFALAGMLLTCNMERGSRPAKPFSYSHLPACLGLSQPLRLLDMAGSHPFSDLGPEFQRRWQTGQADLTLDTARHHSGLKYQLIGPKCRQAVHSCLDTEPRAPQPPAHVEVAWTHERAALTWADKPEQGSCILLLSCPPPCNRAQLPPRRPRGPCPAPAHPPISTTWLFIAPAWLSP